MTIIAAAIGADGTWIGADGLSVAGNIVCSEASQKINVSPCGGLAFAAAGEVTYDGVLLQSKDSIWPRKLAGDALLLDLASKMRTILSASSEFELVRDEDCAFGDYRFSPVVACDGHVWRLNSNLRTFDGPFEGRYQAAGAGADFALGAMSALVATGEESGERLVREGVASACRLSRDCGGQPPSPGDR